MIFIYIKKTHSHPDVAQLVKCKQIILRLQCETEMTTNSETEKKPTDKLLLYLNSAHPNDV